MPLEHSEDGGAGGRRLHQVTAVGILGRRNSSSRRWHISSRAWLSGLVKHSQTSRARRHLDAAKLKGVIIIGAYRWTGSTRGLRGVEKEVGV
jgi:phage terminase large subunit-like protein